MSYDLKPVLEECFALDQDLLNKWHIEAPASLEKCVSRTMSDSNNFDHTFRFYELMEQGELAAYWGTERGNYLNLLFVKPKYRTRDFMAKFWKKVLITLGPIFYTAIYEKNDPAAKFYESQGGIRIKRTIAGNEVLVFEFERDVTCLLQLG